MDAGAGSAEQIGGSAARPGGTIGAVVRAMRPRQWTKNVLIFAAPAAAGVLTEAGPLARTLVAVLAFILVSAGTYLINDVNDVDADRAHPVKRHRPVASGALSPKFATALGIGLLVAGVAIAFIPNVSLGGLVLGYVVLMQGYTHWLKHEPVFDVAVVASGFFLRALAGGLAADVTISRWFLIVAGFGSLFMVTGKRYAEAVQFAEERGTVRASLDRYTPAFLQQVLTMSGTVTVLAYCLWAFEGPLQKGEPHPLSTISIIPFVLAMMRYWLLVDHGRGGEPEEIVLSDRELQVLGLIWAVLFVLGIYL